LGTSSKEKKGLFLPTETRITEVASILGLQEVRDNSVGALMSYPEPQKWLGQYTFVKLGGIKTCGERPHKRHDFLSSDEMQV
jgi:hypothetical protein